VFDPRQSQELHRVNLNGKVLAMSLGNDWRVTLGISPNELQIFDLRKFQNPIESRVSPLKHQIRSLCTFSDNKSYIVSTIEGRCAVECFRLLSYFFFLLASQNVFIIFFLMLIFLFLN
jgi:hypothetical protein